jgi:hypothetical protein
MQKKPTTVPQRENYNPWNRMYDTGEKEKLLIKGKNSTQRALIDPRREISVPMMKMF